MAKSPAEKKLHGILNGFLRSRVLTAGYRLNLYATVAEEAMTREQIFEKLSLPERTGTILINSSLALGLLTEESDGKVRTTPELVEHIVPSDSEFRLMAYMIEFYDALYRDMTNIDEIIKTDGKASQFKLRDYFKEDVNTVDPQLARDYSSYMEATMSRIADVVVEMYDFSQHEYILDLCGGPGTFCRALLQRIPNLKTGVVDVPPVAAIAREMVEGSEFEGKLDVHGGDIFEIDLGGRADCMTMCRSAHDWDDVRVQRVFRRAYEALPSGGKFLIIERMIPDHFNPAAEALYVRAVYFLAKSQTACYRKASDYKVLLGGAGFETVEVVDPSRDPYEFFQGLRMVVATKK